MSVRIRKRKAHCVYRERARGNERVRPLRDRDARYIEHSEKRASSSPRARARIRETKRATDERIERCTFRGECSSGSASIRNLVCFWPMRLAGISEGKTICLQDLQCVFRDCRSPLFLYVIHRIMRGANKTPFAPIVTGVRALGSIPLIKLKEKKKNASERGEKSAK